MRRFRRRRRAFRHINRLRSAHQLYDMGNFFDAAVVFEELASLAESRSRPRAPQLLLQAGRAYAKAGEHKTGYDLLLPRSALDGGTRSAATTDCDQRAHLASYGRPG